MSTIEVALELAVRHGPTVIVLGWLVFRLDRRIERLSEVIHRLDGNMTVWNAWRSRSEARAWRDEFRNDDSVGV